jgi:molecular chaperone DnaJ
VAAKGEAGADGTPTGDLYIRIHVRPDLRFRRQGDDVITAVRVPLLDAVLGGTVTVPTLGDPVKMKIPAGTQNGKRFRIKGRGVGGRGDLFAELQVEIPKDLDPETRQTLEMLRGKL